MAPESYLLGVLADGARPYRFRPGMHELLGLPDDMGVRVTFASMPQGQRFVYLRHGVGEQYAVEDTSQWWVHEEDLEAAASEPAHVEAPRPAGQQKHPLWMTDEVAPEPTPSTQTATASSNVLPGTSIAGDGAANVPPDRARSVDNSAAWNADQPSLSDPFDSMDSGGRRLPDLTARAWPGLSPDTPPGYAPNSLPGYAPNSLPGKARPVDNSAARNPEQPSLSDPIGSMDSGGRRLPGTSTAGPEPAEVTTTGLSPARISNLLPGRISKQPDMIADAPPGIEAITVPRARPEPGSDRMPGLIVEATPDTQPGGRFETPPQAPAMTTPPAKRTATPLTRESPVVKVDRPGHEPGSQPVDQVTEPEPVVEAPPPGVPAFWERRHLRLTRARILR